MDIEVFLIEVVRSDREAIRNLLEKNGYKLVKNVADIDEIYVRS